MSVITESCFFLGPGTLLLKKSFCYFGQVTASAWEQEGQPAAQAAHKNPPGKLQPMSSGSE